MSTTLENCMIELSKQIGDYWASTTTAGTGSSTTVIDTALKAKMNDWVSGLPTEPYDRLTSGTYDNEERLITALDNTTGTLTVLAHGGTVGPSITYEVHRMFNASEKMRALVYAARAGFPYIFKKVRDTSNTVGNWLRNGDFETWTLTTIPDNWAKTGTPTVSENTTAPYFTRGSSSCKIITALGTVYQSNTEVSDLAELAGHSVTFSAQVWSDTASDTRLSIYDGTTTTYSSYHTGGDTFEELSVTATIASSPSSVKFTIHKAGAATIVYVDDCRVIGPSRDKIYIGDLSLAQNYPHEIFESADSSIDSEPWARIRNYEIGSDGYLYLHEGSDDSRLRIIGIGYLSFPVTGTLAMDWALTVDINAPQTDILVAEAIVYLYTQMILPNFTSGDKEKFAPALNYWAQELERRRIKFGMRTPPATVTWGAYEGTTTKSKYGRVNY